jgi:hypothetical protein
MRKIPLNTQTQLENDDQHLLEEKENSLISPKKEK